MTERFEAALYQIAAVVRGVDGLKQVFDAPPELVSNDTFAVIYEESGVFTATPTGTRRGLHNVAIDILRRRVDLSRDMLALRKFVDTVSNALMLEISYDSDGDLGSQFSNTIETYEDFRYSRLPANTDYGGVAVAGYHCVIENVKILVNL